MERFSPDVEETGDDEGRCAAPSPHADLPDAAVVDRPDRALLELVTDHLRLREVMRDDLAALLPVYDSHRPDPAKDPAEREERLRRLVHEWRVLETLRTHHTLAIYRRDEDDAFGAPVGVLDYMDESPHTHVPWLGLVVVDAAHTGEGIAREALEALFAYGASLGWTRIGTGVPDEDATSRAFLAHFGFVETGHVPGPVPGEAAGALTVLERSLAPESEGQHG